MNVIIIGCGKVGVRLANLLCRLGHEVSIVDRHAENFNSLGPDFTGITVAGIAIDMNVLREAGIENCDAVAAVTSDDNLNIVVSQIAIEFFDVQRVVTRILDPARESIFEKFGLKTVCPTRLTARAMLNALEAKHDEQMVNFGVSSLGFMLRHDRRWVGHPIEEIPVHDDEMIIGVMNRHGRIQFANRPDLIYGENDKLVVTEIID